MTWIITALAGASPNADQLAIQLDTMMSSAFAQMNAYKTAITNTSAVDAQQTQDVYQTWAALRAFGETYKSTNGLGAAIIRNFPSHGQTWDPGVEWAALRTPLDSFLAWIQANWPEKAASGKPAFVLFSPTDGQLMTFSIALSAGSKNALLGQINAVLACFAGS
jgi:hypothetical protein